MQKMCLLSSSKMRVLSSASFCCGIGGADARLLRFSACAFPASKYNPLAEGTFRFRKNSGIDIVGRRNVRSSAYQGSFPSYASDGGPLPSSTEVPVIEEIDFDASLTNSITIMGNVGQQPEIRYFENGNKLAKWSIANRPNKDAETQWIDIEAWGALADVVMNRISKGERIVVQGRLKIRNWSDREGTKRRSISISANSIKKVRSQYSSSSIPMSATSGGATQQPEYHSAPSDQMISPLGDEMQRSSTATPSVTTEELWMSFFEDTSGWYDNRPRKIAGDMNPRAPDFKKKDGGRDAPALWIDSRTTPGWVRSELDRLDKAANDLPPF